MSRSTSSAQQPQYATAVDKYPNDLTVVNNIGVVYDRLGRASDALAMYRRAIAVGSAPALTYSNAMFSAGWQGRLDVADTVLQQFQRDMPQSPYLTDAAAGYANYRQDFRAVDSIARVMIRRTPLEQFGGYQFLSMTAELHGRMTEAGRELRNALRVEQSRSQLSSEEADVVAQASDIRRIVEYSDGGKSRLPQATALLEKSRAITAQRSPLARRHDLFIPLFVALGDAELARQVMKEHLEAMARSTYPAMGARVRDHAFQAQVATATGRPEEALVLLRDGCSLAPSIAALCERMAFLEAAQAHDRLGRVDSAIAGYRRFVELRAFRMLNPPRAMDIATPKIAPTWRRLGELYESKGDRRSAIEAYERFLEYWRDADPELQPIVRQVRERTDRLRRATG